MTAGRIEITAKLPHIHLEHAGRMGSIEHDQNSFLVSQLNNFSGWQNLAVSAGHMGYGDNSGLFGDGSLNIVQSLGCVPAKRGDFDHHPVSFGSGVPGDGIAGVLMIGDNDLVTSFEFQPLSNDIYAFGHIMGQGDFFFIAVNKLGHFSPGDIMSAIGAVKIYFLLFGKKHPLNVIRGWTHGAVIHIDDVFVFSNRELLPYKGPEFAIGRINCTGCFWDGRGLVFLLATGHLTISLTDQGPTGGGYKASTQQLKKTPTRIFLMKTGVCLFHPSLLKMIFTQTDCHFIMF